MGQLVEGPRTMQRAPGAEAPGDDPVKSAYMAAQIDLDKQFESIGTGDKEEELAAAVRADYIALREAVLARIPQESFPSEVSLIDGSGSALGKKMPVVYHMGEEVSQDTVTEGDRVMGVGQFTRRNGIAVRVVRALIQPIPAAERRQYQRVITSMPLRD